MEYFIEICSEKKTHNFRIVGEVVLGHIFTPETDEDEVFARAAEPDQVEIEEIYLYTGTRERKLEMVPEALLDIIKEKIISEEKGV